MFHYMEYVYAVYKAGSFSAAADKLYLTQPCLSAMVKKAEEPLFSSVLSPFALFKRKKMGYNKKDYTAKIMRRDPCDRL